MEGHPELQKKDAKWIIANLDKVPEAIRMRVRNHGGGFVNHGFFWKILKKNVKISGEILKQISKAFGSFEEFLGKLKRASSVHDIENVYKRHKIEARIFSEFTGNMPLPEKEMKLLNGMLFNKLDLILEYEDAVNFIARDGGEIREKIAYEADGKTQKEGWKRLYFK